MLELIAQRRRHPEKLLAKTIALSQVGPELAGMDSFPVSALRLPSGIEVYTDLRSSIPSLASKIARSWSNDYDESIVRHARRRTRVISPLAAALFALPDAGLPQELEGRLTHAVVIALIACTGWLVIALLGVVDDGLEKRFPVNVKDNLAARKVRTQMAVFHRISP